MPPEIFVPIISATMGGIFVKLVEAIKEWAVGRKDEAQRKADQLDKAQNETHSLRELLTATRQIALKHGATYEELPRLDRTKD